MKLSKEELNYEGRECSKEHPPCNCRAEEEKKLLESFSDALSNKSKSIRSLVAHLYMNHKETFLGNYVRLNDFHNAIGMREGSTGKEDCWLLYLLVKEFKPKCIFEAGTFIGTTSKFLADAAMTHGGEVHTCDPVNSYTSSATHDSSIYRYTMGAVGLVAELEHRRKEVDFAFFDTDLPNNQVEDLLGVAAEEFVLVAHDFYDSDDNLSKGARNLIFAWRILESRGYQLFIPDLAWSKYRMDTVRLKDGTKVFSPIGGTAAALLPPSFKLEDHLWRES
ncbi:hypothetical protein CMI37_22225 [Candidatus Pacearchaeota archaeon]|nr:hypothetical protein [Candidatus Pacearchaeota archaeon]|tara:strand:- start:21050 stop:21883 length:834 start_codon:yes stop_codon:yes gene_type:complete